MGIFSRKQKVNARDFCTPLYDHWISLLDSESENAKQLKTILDFFVDNNPRMKEVAFDHFLREIVTFQFEAFSHVWQSRCGINHSYAYEQTLQSRQFILSRNLNQIWDDMLAYNQSITTINSTYKNPDGAAARAGNTILNEIKVTKFDEMIDAGQDPYIAARVANRIGDLRPWTRPDHALQQQMASIMANRLAPQISNPTLTPIGKFISMVYDDFVHMTCKIKVTG